MTGPATPPSAARGASLRDRVLAALSDDIVGADDQRLTVHLQRADQLGEATATYHQGDTLLATRRVRVDERSRVVSLLGFDAQVWWFDRTRIHQQFLAHLAGTPCLLRGPMTGPRSWLWAPHFHWASGMNTLNAAALQAAVEAVTPAPGQTVWGGPDLPDRIQHLAGPDPVRDDGHGSWRHLVENTTPSGLVERLDTLHQGLAAVVYTHMPAWYGERAVT